MRYYLDQSLDAEKSKETAINDEQDLLLLWSYHKIVVSLLNCVNYDRNQDKGDESLAFRQLNAELTHSIPATFRHFRPLDRGLIEGLQEDSQVVSLVWV